MSTANGLAKLNALLAGGHVIKALQQLPADIRHLNAHERGTLPCLCKGCVAAVGESVRVDEMDFVLDGAIAANHFLLYWVPKGIAADRDEIRRRVASSLRSRR